MSPNSQISSSPHATTQPIYLQKPISISKILNWKLIDSIIDTEGRYIVLKVQIHSWPVTFANIYSPNSIQVTFFRSVAQILTDFQTGLTILGGDFNVAIYPILDTSSGTASLPYKSLRQIKIQLQDLILHDTWRTLHPNSKDYTFFSAPLNRYSRLDYLFVSQKDLPLLTNASIEPMLLSDHHPISMTLTWPDKNTFNKIWHLDSSLLTPEPDVNQIHNFSLSREFW